MNRKEQLQANLADIRGDVSLACAQARRATDDITLIAVTKGFPSDDVRILAELGVADVGESRADEGLRKRADVEAVSHSNLRWHCIGQVQTNKAARVARWADVVHSIDRASLITALNKGAAAAGRCIDVLIQVDIRPLDVGSADVGSIDVQAEGGGESASEPIGLRGGCRVGEVLELASHVAQVPNLSLRGVMTVADPDLDPAQVFRVLAEVSALLRQSHPAATMISAGMSGDFREAIAAGATHLRIGSAILGERG